MKSIGSTHRELTFADLRIHYYTGHSYLISGEGRNKVIGYRSGVMTDIGDLSEDEWIGLAKQLIHQSGEQELYQQLLTWEKEHRHWKRKEPQLELDVLSMHIARLPDDPAWCDFMQLSQLGHQTMAVDENEKRINNILPFVTNAQIGDSTSAEFLRSLGIGNYDVCIMTIGGSFQNSLETTSLLKELGAKCVVSRAERDVQAKFLLRNGADHVVYPEKQVAKWAAIRYTADHILGYIEVDEQHAIFEVEVPEGWIRKSIGELDIRRKYGMMFFSNETVRPLRTSLICRVFHYGHPFDTAEPQSFLHIPVNAFTAHNNWYCGRAGNTGVSQNSAEAALGRNTFLRRKGSLARRANRHRHRRRQRHLRFGVAPRNSTKCFLKNLQLRRSILRRQHEDNKFPVRELTKNVCRFQKACHLFSRIAPIGGAKRELPWFIPYQRKSMLQKHFFQNGNTRCGCCGCGWQLFQIGIGCIEGLQDQP